MNIVFKTKILLKSGPPDCVVGKCGYVFVSSLQGIAVIDVHVSPARITAGWVGRREENIFVSRLRFYFETYFDSNSNYTLIILSACPYIVCLNIYV